MRRLGFAPGGIPGNPDGPVSAPLVRTYRVLSPKRARAARAHLDLVYGDGLDTAQKETILSQSLKHLLGLPFHLMRTLLWSREKTLRTVHVDPESKRALEQALEAGKGLFLISGHIGYWELGLRVSRMLFPERFCVISKPFSPRWLYNLFVKTRGCALTIEKDGAARDVIQALRDNRIVCVLIDQNRPDGAFVPFFGEPASTGMLVPTLALRKDVPVFSTACLKTERGYELTFNGPLDLSAGGETSDAAMRAAEVCNEAIEHFVRQAPGQFLWTHLRFKRGQAGEPNLYERARSN